MLESNLPEPPRPSDGLCRPMSERKTLSAREQAFVQAFLVHNDATKAAIEAGYSPKTAPQIGYQLTRRPRVAAAIEAGRARIAEKYRISAERTLEEMATIGYSDIRNYTIDGQPIADWLQLTPDAPKNAMRAVKKVKRTVRNVRPRDGTDPYTELETEVEFWNKDSQLKHLGDYQKLFKENRADDADEENLTPAELEERVISILKVAQQRKRLALARSPARKRA
jgi:phage terminase small subunit